VPIQLRRCGSSPGGPPISFSCLPLGLGDRVLQTLRVVMVGPIRREEPHAGEWPSALQNPDLKRSAPSGLLVVPQAEPILGMTSTKACQRPYVPISTQW
jgi:hypothetical protein